MRDSWADDASCKDQDTNLFFEKYEESISLRSKIDKMCHECPVVRKCFAIGISQKEWGVWGGVYLESGEISREFSRHREKSEWAEKWKNLTIDK
jgi:hypothetical protein